MLGAIGWESSTAVIPLIVQPHGPRMQQCWDGNLIFQHLMDGRETYWCTP
jgi:hypothetical protein